MSAMANHAGFDRYDYPGNAVMQWLQVNTNLSWCGYYLGPLPEHGGTSWMGRRAALEGAGWGVAALYVGQQVHHGTFAGTAHNGSSDGSQAAHMMAAEGFPPGSFVYLDLENGLPVFAAQLTYVQAWC